MATNGEAERERAEKVAQDAAAVLDRADELVEKVDWTLPEIAALADVAVDLSKELNEKLVVIRRLLETQQERPSE